MVPLSRELIAVAGGKCRVSETVKSTDMVPFAKKRKNKPAGKRNVKLNSELLT
jgi:hypothetical protein